MKTIDPAVARAGRSIGVPLRGERFLRTLFLVASVALPAIFMARKSITVDELSHLPAGYSYLRTGSVTLNPMHPPLVKELCALPLLALGAKMPVSAEELSKLATDVTYQREFGQQFFLTQDADRLLFWGRVPAVLLSAGLAIVTMLWAQELWGPPAGLLVLLLHVLDPTITAHAQLVTTDVGLAFFATLFLYLLRKVLAAPSLLRLIAAGTSLGLALGAKFSAVLLIPIAAVLLATAMPARRLAWAAGVAGIVAYVILWIIYLCPSDPLFYVRGLRSLDQDVDPNYLHLLMGELKPGGWWWYLPVAWMVKTPLPTLLLFAAAAAAMARGVRAPFREELFLAVPALGFFVVTSAFSAPIGIRYLLPVYPLMFVFTARLAAVASSWLACVAAGLLLAWTVAEYASISPDHLSYFNQLAGGPRGGIEWLDDSNVDWGQGLIQLRDYLRSQPEESFRFCYFGTFDPGYYGIHGEPTDINALLSPPSSGTLILSAHCVARAEAALRRRYGEGPGNWIAHEEPKAIVGHAYYVYEIG